MLYQYVKLKQGTDPSELLSVHPSMLILLSECASYAKEQKIDLVVSDILSEALDDAKLQRVSKTHAEGRAIDLSVHGWSVDQIQGLISRINSKYTNIGAVSAVTGKGTPVVFHNNGNGWHFHLQCKP